MMPAVMLTEQEWQALVNVLANSTGSPWVVTHPLIAKIGEQLRAQPLPAKGNAHEAVSPSRSERDGEGVAEP